MAVVLALLTLPRLSLGGQGSKQTHELCDPGPVRRTVVFPPPCHVPAVDTASLRKSIISDDDFSAVIARAGVWDGALHVTVHSSQGGDLLYYYPCIAECLKDCGELWSALDLPPDIIGTPTSALDRGNTTDNQRLQVADPPHRCLVKVLGGCYTLHVGTTWLAQLEVLGKKPGGPFCCPLVRWSLVLPLTEWYFIQHRSSQTEILPTPIVTPANQAT
jgi:hypothetical protein